MLPTPRLADLRWPDLPERPTLVVPLGSLEQHGPHLPLDTDSVIAKALAERLVAALTTREAAVLSPVVPFGASGEHQDFPGTVSLGTQALALVLVELGRSASTWAGRIVFVSAHGGNRDALLQAVRTLQSEGREVFWLTYAVPGGDAHAGRTETSLMLALDPSRTRADLAAPGMVGGLASLLPRLRAEGVRAVSSNGVLGDPTEAGSDEGDSLLTVLVPQMLQELDALSAAWRSGVSSDGRSEEGEGA